MRILIVLVVFTLALPSVLADLILPATQPVGVLFPLVLLVETIVLRLVSVLVFEPVSWKRSIAAVTTANIISTIIGFVFPLYQGDPIGQIIFVFSLWLGSTVLEAPVLVWLGAVRWPESFVFSAAMNLVSYVLIVGALFLTVW